MSVYNITISGNSNASNLVYGSNYAKIAETHPLPHPPPPEINDDIIGSILDPSTRYWVSGGTGGSVSCADNYAAEAAIQCLKSGGNAFDATVACMAVIGLTKPDAAGLGGGGYAVLYKADTKRVETMDFREVSPLKTSPYFNATGNIGGFNGRRQQGTAVGVPGTPMFFKELLERHGTYTLGQCFQPAIKLANNGFIIDDNLNLAINSQKDVIRNFPDTSAKYLDGSFNALPSGTTIKNPDYAKTLQLIADTNCDAFYRGVIADDIVKCVAKPPAITSPTVLSGTSYVAFTISGGVMQREDLELYHIRINPPIKTRFRNVDVYSVPPSTSGGLAIAEGLALYQGLYPIVTKDASGVADSYYNRLLAMKYAFADRGVYVADPMFYPVPVRAILDPSYIEARVKTIRLDNSLNKVAVAAKPSPIYSSFDFSANNTISTLQYQPITDPTNVGSTTAVIVTDSFGNIACIIFTIEQRWGSGMTVPGRGFVLNNELTDFDNTALNGIITANSPEPYKRPRSSMSTTLVFKDGIPLIALACSGGSRIPTTIFEAIVNKVDYGYSIENILLEGRYSQTNATTTNYDVQANDQSGNQYSAMKLLTTYKGVPQSHFTPFITYPQTFFACITFDGLQKAGYNLPVTISNTALGSAKTINPTYTIRPELANDQTLKVWKPPVV